MVFKGGIQKSVVQKTRGLCPLFIGQRLCSEVFEVFSSLDVLQRLIDELNAVFDVAFVHHFYGGVHVAQGNEISALGTPLFE